MKFDVDDKVRKKSGYEFPGVIVSKFEKLDGSIRYVVESTVTEVEGILHIYSADDLEYRDD
jgi:hypothetical protein